MKAVFYLRPLLTQDYFVTRISPNYTTKSKLVLTVTSILSYVIDELTSISNEHTFLQDFLDILKRSLQNIKKILRKYSLGVIAIF